MQDSQSPQIQSNQSLIDKGSERRRGPSVRRGAGYWWAAILGAILVIFGLIIGGGGAWLLTLGGTWYYLVAGIGLIVSGGLIMRHDRWGVWIYVATWLMTVIWAYSEVGFDGWALVPRDLGPTILLVAVLLTLPVLAARGPRRAHSGAAWSSAAAIALVAGSFAYHYGGPHGAAAQEAATGETVPNNAVAVPQNATPKAAAPSAEAAQGVVIPATGVSVSSAPTQNLRVGADWPAYGGTDLAKRYSPLDEITTQNVAKLQKVWTFHTGDMPNEKTQGKYSPEDTPIKVGHTLYMCSPMNIMIAVDAANGKKIWSYNPKVPDDAIPYGATCRGVAYYKTPKAAPDAPCTERIIESTLDARLLAVDAKTGRLCTDFGKNGKVDLNEGIGKSAPGWYAVDVPPVIVRGIVVVGAQVKDVEATQGPSGVIRGYDAVTGKLAWAWDMEHPDNQGAPPPGQTYGRGTPNMWTEPAADPELGYVYLPLGNTSVDYWGGDRTPQEKKYSSALVAVDVTTGKPVWQFQTVHFDVWDYDLGSQPSLIDFPTDRGSVPALILPSKTGQIFVLDRKTGKPLVPVEERKVPGGGVEPQNMSKTQPYSTYAHLDDPPLKASDTWGMTPIDQLVCRIQFHRAAYAGEYTPPTADRPFIEYPSYNGGSDWGSMAVDEHNGIVVANYNNLAMYDQLIPREKANELGLKPITERKPGQEGKPDYGAQAGAPYAIYTNAGWRLPTGLPCTKPPFGRIRAFDLKTGKTLWDHPFGSATNNGPFGIASHLPITIGTPNNGGPIVTAGGLIFVAATTDDELRAISLKTGKVLWKAHLPGGGQATPMTYKVDGRQYIVIAPGGHHFMHTKVSDAVVAYALPK